MQTLRNEWYSVWLKEIVGGAVTMQEEISCVSAANQWYDMSVRIKDTRLEVWHGKRDEYRELIHSYDDVQQLQTNSVQLWTRHDAAYEFDFCRWHAPANFHEFLQLASGSPCIDSGFQHFIDNNGNETYDPGIDKLKTFHDFAGMLGPLDGDNPEGGATPNDLTEERDIGADEWPQPEVAMAWWENF